MYPGHRRVTVHETHASWVFVTGDRAYKVKKPVALGFLDYSTLARRLRACREEVRVNRVLAPDIYLGVRSIVRAGAGYRLAGERARGAVEYAVEMRRYREQDTLAAAIAAGSLTRKRVAEVAHRLVEFHREAPVVSEWDAQRVLEVWLDNVRELSETSHPPHWRVDVPAEHGRAFVRRHALELRRRSLLGLARDGHGDLRCEHVLLRPNVRVVDRVEFDPGLRRTDVACDLAFLAMDLEAHGQRAAASELYGAYRHGGISPGSERLRSFYAAHWALVRAKVALIAAAERGITPHERDTTPHEQDAKAQEAQALWSLSERLCWRARAPVALVICGPAGSGKSTLAGELSRRSELPALSTDVVRKRLAGVAEHEPARAEHYTARFTRASYEQLARDAIAQLRHGDGVIVDGTCRARADRALLLDRLWRVGMTRLVVRCEAPLEVALERASRRGRERKRVSDATPEIAREQFHAFQELDELPPGEVLRLDTTRPMEAQIADVALAVDRLSCSYQLSV
jgi:uncharacterized protein